MELNINNSEYSEERANSQPLSLNEQYEAVEKINGIISSCNHFSRRIPAQDINLIQRMLYDYQNKTDFFTIQGGWDGVNRLRDKANAYDELIKQNK